MRLLPTISLAISLVLSAWTASAESIRILVQSSPLAGSQYHALAEVQKDIKVGDALALVREPDNPHDPNAIRVEWHGRLLGYVPRADNRALAAALARGERLSARVVRLADSIDPWRRVEFAVYADL